MQDAKAPDVDATPTGTPTPAPSNAPADGIYSTTAQRPGAADVQSGRVVKELTVEKW
ncbi:MAG: hypothetical protein ACLSHW_08550 [Lachnospiraceae bacterium]